MRLLAALLLLGSVACATDARRVADAATSHYWLEDSYEARCVRVPHAEGSPELAACRTQRPALDTLRFEAQTAEAAMSRGKGHLPKLARKRLQAAKDAAERAFQ